MVLIFMTTQLRGRQFSSLAERGWKFNNFVYAHTKS